jgi:tRNA-dihydrouridine synthase
MLFFDLYFYREMPETSKQINPNIYLAPLQGFTDHVYRKAYNEIFNGIDAFFIPYISVKNNQVLKKYETEIFPANNPQQKVIPQVLVSNPGEIQFLSKFLEEVGYREINLNLGCPYPMVTNRELGAGLLPHPEKLQEILSLFFEKSKLNLSIKLRAGLSSPNEIEKLVPVLNRFPLTEVIFHPRIAKQLYEGEILYSVFEFVSANLKHQLAYNGDILSVSDFKDRKQKFQGTNNWMIGRGVLMNPFLPSEIKGICYTHSEKLEKLRELHQRILELYSEKMDNAGNVLNKMKQFWIYFSFAFHNQHKALKWIKKSSSLNKYRDEVLKIFRDY